MKLRARLCAALALLCLLTACPTERPAAEMTLQAEEYYASAHVALSFTVTGAETGWSYHALLAERQGPELVTLRSLELAAPTGGAGDIELELDDGEYRIELQVMARRGLGSYELEFLRKVVYFAVDTTVPSVPQASEAAGTFSAPFEVFLSHPDLGELGTDHVEIYYTLNNTPPTTGSARYDVGMPIDISATGTTTLKAIAVDRAGNTSGELDVDYQIVPPAATPPTVGAVSPSKLNVHTDDDATLTVTGTNFTADALVSVTSPGVVRGGGVTVSSSTLIFVTVSVTAMAAGSTLDVTVTTPQGTASGGAVQLVAEPILRSVTPSSGSITQNDVFVWIHGAGFVPGLTVELIDSTPVTPTTVSATSVSYIDSGLTTARFDLTGLALGAGRIHLKNPDDSWGEILFTVNP